LDLDIDTFNWMDRIRVKGAQNKGFDFNMSDAQKLVDAGSSSEVEKLIQSKDMTWKDLQEIERTKERKKIEKMKNKEIQLNEGVNKLLSNLSISAAIVTNASKMSTKFMLTYYDLHKDINQVEGLNINSMKEFFDTRKPRPIMIEEVQSSLGLKRPLMVGDSNSDIKAANNAGIDSIHIRSHWEIDQKPTYSINKIKEIEEIISSN